MFASARKAAELIFDPAFRRVVLKAAGLTLLLFLILLAGAELGVRYLPLPHLAQLEGVYSILAGIAVLLAIVFLGGPVAALFASLFLDEIAAAVETRHYPGEPPSRGAPFWPQLFLGLRLFVLLVLAKLLLLPFDFLIPGVGNLISLVVSGWLLGREYFELAALRHLPRKALDRMRRRHSAPIAGAGTLIALTAAIPVVNLFAPLFGVALMVHEFKRYATEDRIA
ncbi:MAG TPA: EI24 domain-containing protein [Rhizomicrobium sp.]|jgi:CysZ protein|nr:EI24 domain-containing protein [Rhizomicrobium sp.]